jgi:CHAT domain-containing protein
MGDLEHAQAYLDRAIPIFQRVYQGRGFHLMEANHHLSRLLHGLGRQTDAERYAEDAVRLCEQEATMRASSSAQYYEHLAELKLDLGKPDQALHFAQQGRALREQVLAAALSFTSERQRLELMAGTVRPQFLATLGAATPLAEGLLRTKGLVVDSLVEDAVLARFSGDPQTVELLQRLEACRQRRADLWSSPASGRSDAEIEELESALARRLGMAGRAHRALRVTVPEIQQVIPPKTALVEYMRYERYLGYEESEPEYGAVLLTHDRPSQWVRLGPAAPVEQQFRRVCHAVRDDGEASNLTPALMELTERIWEPVARLLPHDIREIIISPDAVLSLVSFAALTPDARSFVGERYLISYVSSGRDLLTDPMPAIDTPGRLCVFANPQFSICTPGTSSLSRSSLPPTQPPADSLPGFNFQPLPGAELEGRALRERARELGFNEVELLLGANATEAALRRLQQPRFLHLATHGFRLPRDPAPTLATNDPRGRALLQRPAAPPPNPMLRSGLLLAGARDALLRRASGEVVALENDGIVTADELASLNLHGTRLVVVSSCDSGGGEVETGEGVLGLRRGFIKAGARNLLLALWQVEDGATAPLLAEFYLQLHQTGSAPRALASVQREWLQRLRQQHGLAAACRIAGPFILSFQGPPEPVGSRTALDRSQAPDITAWR